MQLHKRKRCYGATQDVAPPPPSQAVTDQHFFGVTVKQEPVSLSSSCPLSSPKQLKSSPGSCMEDMGHCSVSMGCVDAAPCSGSPSPMSAFLSPQVSPIGKPPSSPRPSSPNNPYLLPPPGRGHAHSPGSSRARGVQVRRVYGKHLRQGRTVFMSFNLKYSQDFQTAAFETFHISV